MKKLHFSMVEIWATLLIQIAASSILLVFVHHVLLRRDDYQALISVMLYVSPDTLFLDIIVELLQLTLFLPAMLFVSLAMIRKTDADYSYLIVRHQYSFQWYVRTILKTAAMSLTAAFTAVSAMLIYSKLFIRQSFQPADSAYVVLAVSISLGILFYASITWLISLGKPVLFLITTLVIAISSGKVLVHASPGLIDLTAVSALSTNHLFSQSFSIPMGLPDLAVILRLVAGDLAIICLICFFVYQRLQIMNIIGRES